MIWGDEHMLDFLFGLSMVQVILINLAFLGVNIGFSFIVRLLVKKKYEKTNSIEKALYLEQKLIRYIQFILIMLTTFFSALTICPHIPDFAGDNGVFIVVGVVLIEMFIVLISNTLILHGVNKKLRNTTTTAKESALNMFRGILVGVIPLIIIFVAIVLLKKLELGENVERYIKIGIIVLVYMSISIIMPFFLKYLIKSSDMDGEYKDLREELYDFISKSGLKNVDIRLWKTKGDRHANALVSGLIKKRVFIGDYLIDNFTSEEIKGILAHEIGHIKKYHLWIRNLLIMGIIIIMPLLGRLMDLYEDSFTDIPVFFGIAILGIILIGYSVLFTRYVTRVQERQADAFVLSMGIEGKVYISALYKLAKLNNVMMKPNKLDEKFHTHPSIAKRIRWIMKEANIPEDEISFQD